MRYFCTRKLNSESNAPRKIATERERMITMTVYWKTVFRSGQLTLINSVFASRKNERMACIRLNNRFFRFKKSPEGYRENVPVSRSSVNPHTNYTL